MSSKLALVTKLMSLMTGGYKKAYPATREGTRSKTERGRKPVSIRAILKWPKAKQEQVVAMAIVNAIAQKAKIKKQNARWKPIKSSAPQIEVMPELEEVKEEVSIKLPKNVEKIVKGLMELEAFVDGINVSSNAGKAELAKLVQNVPFLKTINMSQKYRQIKLDILNEIRDERDKLLP